MIIKNLGKDTVLYGSSDAIVNLIAFVSFPFIASALSPQGFGTFELTMSLVGIVGLFVNCGINNAVQRFYWDTHIESGVQHKIVSTGLFLQFIFWVVMSLLIVSSLPFLQKLINFQTYGFSFVAVFSAILLVFVSQSTQYIQDTLRLHFAPSKFFIFSLVSKGASAILAFVVVVLLAGGIDGMMFILVVSGLLALPLGLFMIKKDLCFCLDKEWAKKIVSYGYPFIFMGVSYWIFGSMDRWMISFMGSVQDTGVYSVAFRFSSIVMFLSLAFGRAWSPYAIKVKTENPNHYRSIYSTVFMILIFGMLFFGGGLSLFSGEIISLFMHNTFYDASLSLSVLCFAMIFQSTQHITALGLSLEKKTTLLAKISMVAVVVNFVGNWFLIKLAGLTGAAFATLISYMFITSCYLYFSQKVHSIPLLWKKLLIFVVLGSCIFLVSILFNTTVLSWPMVGMKVMFAFVCLIIGYVSFPIKSVMDDTKA